MCGFMKFNLCKNALKHIETMWNRWIFRGKFPDTEQRIDFATTKRPNRTWVEPTKVCFRYTETDKKGQEFHHGWSSELFWKLLMSVYTPRNIYCRVTITRFSTQHESKTRHRCLRVEYLPHRKGPHDHTWQNGKQETRYLRYIYIYLYIYYI